VRLAEASLWGQGATPLQEGNSSAFPCHAEGWHRGSRYDIAILLSEERQQKVAVKYPIKPLSNSYEFEAEHDAVLSSMLCL